MAALRASGVGAARTATAPPIARRMVGRMLADDVDGAIFCVVLMKSLSRFLLKLRMERKKERFGGRTLASYPIASCKVPTHNTP